MNGCSMVPSSHLLTFMSVKKWTVYLTADACHARIKLHVKNIFTTSIVHPPPPPPTHTHTQQTPHTINTQSHRHTHNHKHTQSHTHITQTQLHTHTYTGKRMIMAISISWGIKSCKKQLRKPFFMKSNSVGKKNLLLT